MTTSDYCKPVLTILKQLEAIAKGTAGPLPREKVRHEYRACPDCSGYGGCAYGACQPIAGGPDMHLLQGAKQARRKRGLRAMPGDRLVSKTGEA